MSNKTASADKLNNLQETMSRLESKYGKGTVLTLETKPVSDLEVYSTGSIAFDYIALGIGGFAKSKLYELMGWEATGKTTICGHVTAECQRQGGTVLYIDGEHAVDKEYFKALGVNTEKMLLSQPSTGEEGFNIAIEMAKSGDIDLIIIDTDSSLLPKKVVDGEVGEHAVGHKAKLNSNAYPKLKTVVSQYNVCLIAISQYRQKIGMMFGDPTTTQGGHALKYYTDCRIQVSKTLAKDGDDVYGDVTKIKVIKNKMSAPFKIASFEIIYGKGIDKVGEVISLLKDYGLAKTRLDVITIDGEKQNLAEFKNKIISDKAFYRHYVDMILEKINAPSDG